MNFLNDLNPQQKQAVTYEGGPLLILAGAGSGKTRALTYRAAWLILAKKVPAANLLLLTFTNKAAEEMKERIKKLLRYGIRDTEEDKSSHLSPITYHLSPISSFPYAGTFHSFCARLLRKEGKLIGIPPNYLIFDEDDSTRLLREIEKKMDISTQDFSPKSVLATISSAKNEMLEAREYLSYARGFWQETVGKIFFEYQKELQQADGLDFDDLLLETVKLFRSNPQVLARYQNIYQYILIDEYHDTNLPQYELTKLLAKRFANLTVVGDCSQSIYSWRGADFRNVLKLKNDFLSLKTINLEQNYRSTQKILDAAHAVIAHNTTHPVLKLWTKNGGGEKIILYEAQDEREEANFIIQNVRHTGHGTRDMKEISPYILHTTYYIPNTAILYRTNAQSRVVEETFIHAGIPYMLIGGVKFYERKEIKDVLAYLRLLANPKDIVSYKRVEKLGKGRLEKFLEFSAKQLDSKTAGQLKTLELINQVFQATGYLDLYNPKDEEDLARLENIKELRSVAAEFPTLTDFLENVALVSREAGSRSAGQREYLPTGKAAKLASYHVSRITYHISPITLMTLHAAKGLEFDTVFIIGMEEGLFPHSRSLMDKMELEEERRLCYVGLTRAKQKLYLTYTRRRLYFGRRAHNEPSRFINEIPAELVSFV